MKMNPSTMSRIIFNERHKYKDITEKEKESMFFMVNQYMSRIFPKQAERFNFKGMDKAVAMDIWFIFAGYKYKYIPSNFFPDWKNIKTPPKEKKKKEKKAQVIKVTKKRKKK